MHELIIDYKPLSDFGCYITNSGQYDAPERDVETKEIPGRNGALVIDNGRYANITVTYAAYIYKDADFKINWLNAFLMSHTGYVRIEDTVHPDIYRLGRFSGPIKHKITNDAKMSAFDLSFDCKPQRFLKDGGLWKDITSGMILYNYTDFIAKPVIRVVGSGTINGITIASNNYSHIDIDSSIMDCYSDTVNCNSLMTGRFPKFTSGENKIVYSGFSSVKIKPNWWTI